MRKRKQYDSNNVVEQLRQYQVSRGMTWQQVADKLGLSRGMIMMVLRGDRRLSAKALFKLGEAERDAANLRSAIERIVETLINDSIGSQVVERGRKRKKTIELAVDYSVGRKTKALPAKISLRCPADEDCRKLRALFAETIDTGVIALACLPRELRNEAFIDRLTAESRSRLTTAALDLVIPDWRTLVTGGM